MHGMFSCLLTIAGVRNRIGIIEIPRESGF